MRFAIRTIGAAGALALGLAGAAAAGPMEIVSAGGEYAAAHPRPAAVAPASDEDFPATMDRVFGPGRWRQTSGYRTLAQENALRRQGAGAVARGRISYHSLGGPNAPAAYDAVVEAMSPARAAAKLRAEAGGFARVVAERAHGPQGPHLHVELVSARARTRGPASAADD